MEHELIFEGKTAYVCICAYPEGYTPGCSVEFWGGGGAMIRIAWSDDKGICIPFSIV